jgi:integrase
MAIRMATLRRTKSGSWISRKIIPEDVRSEYRATYGRGWEERFHLGPEHTAQSAKVAFSEWQADIDNRIAMLRAKQRGEGHDLTQREASALAGEWYRWFVGQREDNPGKADHWAELREVLRLWLEDVASDPQAREIHIDWEAPEIREEIHPKLADEAKTAQFLASKGETLTPTAMTLFLDAVLHEFLEATALLERRALRDYSPDQHLKTLPEYRKATPPSIPRPGASSRASGQTAMLLFEGYIIAKKLADGTVRRWRVVFTTLDAYLAGRDFDAPAEDEAQRWVTSLVTEDRSAGTVQTTYVSALNTIGGWAVKQRHISRNPFADCSVPVPRKTRHRETQAYSTEEIRKILSACSAITHPRPPPAIAARRWVPWICAYTGARAGEITQLRGQDVIEQDGIKAIRITPDAGPVKTRQARTVPIHEHLVAQGFFDYARAKGKGPLFYSSAPTTADGGAEGSDITHPKRSQADKVRGKLSAWVRSSVGITDKEVGPTHGWRHTFKQRVDRHGISERVSDAITGHVPLTTGRKYGAPTLPDMAEALNRFPRYEIGD